MSDQYVPTQVETDRGWMHFQEYMVQHRAEPAVKGLAFRGADSAVPAPGVLEAIREAEQIIICPSNPLISIGPILAVPGIRDALRSRRNAVVAVSPLVGGKSLKGPSDRMMAELGYDVSAAGIARMYADIVKTTILDEQDAPLSAEIEKLEMHAILASTVMRNDDDKMRLAQIVLANSAVSHSARSGQ
jgi:LPPG:FO 2-phospho-L-lactate transferase